MRLTPSFFAVHSTRGGDRHLAMTLQMCLAFASAAFSCTGLAFEAPKITQVYQSLTGLKSMRGNLRRCNLLLDFSAEDHLGFTRKPLPNSAR